MISILILTKNEEIDIEECIKSVLWSDDIHVFDSFSEDKTVEIARNLGAKVTQRVFDGYASQRNSALSTLNFKHDWIFILDSDERIPADLVPEMIQLIREGNNKFQGIQFRRRDFLWGKWLKYSQISPYYIRLVRRGKAKYHREINEVLEINGSVLESVLYFNHYPFSKGITHWINKHNSYSSMEALRNINQINENMKFSLKKAIFSKNFSEKRYHQKGLFYKLPGRPLIKFLYMFFLRRGFMDGYPGVTYTLLQCIYEYFIVLKLKELSKTKANIR